MSERLIDSENLGSPPPTEIFYSYSHQDEDLRNKLEAHLHILMRTGVIQGWHDRQISAGTEWAGEIDRHLESARVILLLVSADFLASDYCYDVEMKRAMERHAQGTARVIPIILRRCVWQDAPFGKLQALPKDVKPIKSWADIDEAFTDVAEGIRKAVRELNHTSVNRTPSVSPAAPNHPTKSHTSSSEAQNSAEEIGPPLSTTPSSPSRTTSVFLCHSSGDKALVRELYHRLQEDGFAAWLDEENLLPGQDWAREIPRAVRAATIILVCLSKGAVTKEGYVQREIRLALDVADEKPEDTIFIIPVRLEECNVPDRLSRWHWVNLYEENGYKRLVRALRARAESKDDGPRITAKKFETATKVIPPKAAPEVRNQSEDEPAIRAARIGSDASKESARIGAAATRRNAIIAAAGAILVALIGFIGQWIFRATGSSALPSGSVVPSPTLSVSPTVRPEDEEKARNYTANCRRLNEQAKFKEALSQCDEALKIQPSNQEALTLQAQINNTIKILNGVNR